MTEVVNNPAQHCYELAVDDYLAATCYKVSDGVITFVHTAVPRSWAVKVSDRSGSRARWIRYELTA